MKSAEEVIAGEELDLSGYAGKWDSAKRIALSNERLDDNRLLPYWERVRLLFFELGGERKDGERAA